MIDGCKLKKEDKGRWVRIVNLPGKEGTGRIKSWTDSFIFVVFHCDKDWENYADYTAEAVHGDNLEFTDKEASNES